MRTSFSEEELYAAAEEAQEYLLSLLPSEDSCPPHEFSRAFTAKVEGIYKQLRACTLPHKRAALGWPYYVRRTAAVLFLCFVLTCVAMPEAVEETEFVPLRLGYLPEGMEEIKRYEVIKRVNLVYENKQEQYFRIDQKLIDENDKTTYIIDLEKMPAGLEVTKRKNMRFVCQKKYNEEQINVIWQYERYRIAIQSNLPEEEIVKIINEIEL